MTYYESAENTIISQARAYQELVKHGVEVEWDVFLQEMGEREHYDAQAVLNWLGY